MKSSSTASPKLESASRCIYTSCHGHRCRSLALHDSRYCFSHRRLQKSDADSLISELSQAAGTLNSPGDVSRVLGRVFMALLEDRISLKKAGTLGFLGQMLIRSHREIEYYRKTHRQNEQESAAHELHLLFLKEQDERRARLEARDAEMRRIEAEQAAQAEREATQKAAAAAKTARKEARQAAKKRAAAAKPVAHASVCAPSPNVDCGSSAAAFRSNDTNPPVKVNGPNHHVIAAQKQAAPTIVATASTAPPQPSNTPPAQAPQPDLNHFFPFDPTLAPGRQDHTKNIPPPDAEELRWRELSRQYAHARRRH